MLDDIEEVWTRAGRQDDLHMERFQPVIGGDAAGGDGGEISFLASGETVHADGGTPILVAGEQAGAALPFGCRMGICQSCVLPLESGHVRDFRSGTERGEGDRIQTCISAASGDCTLKI